jgi:hypothetical protein
VQRIRYEVVPQARSSLACVDLKTGSTHTGPPLERITLTPDGRTRPGERVVRTAVTGI